MTDKIAINQKNSFSNYYKDFDLFAMIYRNSKIDISAYGKTSALISYKTSNTQEVIDNMEFYVFNNFMVYLEEIIDEENNEGSGDKTKSADDMKSDASKQLSSSMSKAKSMMPKH